MTDFKGRKVLISGATRGIGKAVAKAFLEAGAIVVGVYGSNRKAAETFSQEWTDNTSFQENRLFLHQCDISDESSVLKLFSSIEDQFDTLDILVNNAGIRRDAILAMMQSDDWHRVIDVNLTGTFNMSKQAVLLMLKQKYGRIINITSPMAHMGFAGQANYAASKAGQIGMMRSLSKETAKRKITVNCISPGFIDTELLTGLSDDQLQQYKKMVPMKRFGKPEEVAAAVLFLAGEEASYINGAVLEVTGGL
ncbi:MAG: beta-ketoacyl-ACP reductase [Deltaproteobacteria bacterium]|jgi:3-oxoacyl-[acyl-carrier protein] reductase|nr:beta-ketoacyl-ACP reductase [Deltaproteobacteria bacterium]